MIIGFPHPPGSGGPGSFQARLERQLAHLGWQIVFLSESEVKPDVILVVGGTRRLLRLWLLKAQGVPVVYRLDGIPWLHRRHWRGVRHYLKNEVRNLLLKVSHAFLAEHVVYQSEFVRTWWGRRGWRRVERWTVIHNGVDLSEFAKAHTPICPTGPFGGLALICVEGHLDYSPYALWLLNTLADRLGPLGMPIRVYGGFDVPSNRSRLSALVDYRGPVARDDVQHVYRDGIYLSLDVNAACPNTVIEAMSSGLPVVGFDTGALSELVPRTCGRIVDYGGDPWALELPAVDLLVEGILEVARDYPTFSERARKHAEKHFDIKQVAARYVEVMEQAVRRRRDGS